MTKVKSVVLLKVEGDEYHKIIKRFEIKGDEELHVKKGDGFFTIEIRSDFRNLNVDKNSHHFHTKVPRKTVRFDFPTHSFDYAKQEL